MEYFLIFATIHRWDKELAFQRSSDKGCCCVLLLDALQELQKRDEFSKSREILCDKLVNPLLNCIYAFKNNFGSWRIDFQIQHTLTLRWNKGERRSNVFAVGSDSHFNVRLNCMQLRDLTLFNPMGLANSGQSDRRTYFRNEFNIWQSRNSAVGSNHPSNL